MAKFKLLKIFTDGGSRGNPGIAGVGIHVEDEIGQTVCDFSGFLGKTTNNVAEYNGLLKALKWLENFKKENEIEKVEFFMDSQLIVEQINKNWKIKKDHLAKLAALIWEKFASLGIEFKLSHIRREKNKIADCLANQAMDFCQKH